MSRRENRAFGLDYSLHTRFLQVKVDCTGQQGLVDDVDKSFGHLNSILSSSRGDEMLSMMNVGRGKLGRTTSNSFGKARMLFGAKFGYGRGANTSLLGNSFTRVASIKQGEDGVLLSKREGFDHDSG